MDYFWNFVASQNNGWETIEFLALAAGKATLLLSLAALFCLIFRRFPASNRHLLWSLALSASLLLPFLSALNVWEVPILPAQITSANPDNFTQKTSDTLKSAGTQTSQTAFSSIEGAANNKHSFEFQSQNSFAEETALETGVSKIESSQPINDSSPSSPINWVLSIWLMGMAILLLRMLIGFIATNLLANCANEFNDTEFKKLFSSLLAELNLKRKVRLLRSERTLMPIVCGVWRPAVLLPVAAAEWSEDRRRMVLLHELTHVARRDCLTQTLAQLACAFYWFNPFVWYGARRLRVEREQACDDFVLSVGAKPSEYAHHLLEIARSVQERSVFEWSQTSTVAMARKSQLEGRLQAILQKERQRRAARSRLLSFGVITAMCALFVSLAIIRPTASRAQESQISTTDSASETNFAEKAALETLLSSPANSKNKAQATEVISKETDKKQENIVDDTQPKQNLTDRQIDSKSEPDVQSGIAGEVETDVAAATVSDTEMPPATEVKPTASAETKVFVNANFEQERKPNPQEKSGDFIDEMAAVGYTKLTIDELIKLKTHGVTGGYVRSLRAVGLDNLTVRELADLRVHGVTPAFVESMRGLGFKELGVRNLTNLRIHNVTPEYIGKIRNAGYGSLTDKELINFRIYNITPEFINAMRAAGLQNLSPRDLNSLRIYNVTPELVRNARSRLGDLTLKQIIELKRQGIIKDSNEK